MRTESGDFRARDDVVAGFQYVNLHRVQQLRLRSEPIVPVVAVRAIPALKEFVRAPCDQVEQTLRMFEKFVRRYKIQICLDFHHWFY